MTDADFRHLLQDVDGHAAGPSSPLDSDRSGSSAALAERVRTRQRVIAVRRRRILASAVVLVLAAITAMPFVVRRGGSFVATIPHPPTSVAPPTAGVANTVATIQPDVSTARLDEQLVEIEQRIAALKRGERLAQLTARRMAVRDPLADADERRATALLDAPRPSPGSAGQDTSRRRVLELVVQLYPQTVAAAVARQEIEKIGTEKRT